MNLKKIIQQAKCGRPELAALNLAVSKADGMLINPVRFLKIIKKYSHESGYIFSLSELSGYYREGLRLRQDHNSTDGQNRG